MIRLKAFLISIVLVLITLVILDMTLLKKIETYYKTNDNSVRYSTSFEKYKSRDIIVENMTPRTLLLLGSSELTTTINENYHPKKIFNYEDFNIMQVGVGNSQNIIHAATIGSIGNDIKFLAVPCVAHYFYEILENRMKVHEEMLNIINFMNDEIYSDLDEYRSHGFTFKDLQETSFGMSCKFARSYGKSRFLQTGATSFKPLINLELRPKLYLRILEDSFDKSTISEYLNNEFTKHEFLTSDLHMSTYITEMTNESNGAFEFLQMVNFDRYLPDSHMIKHNGRDEKNDDVPEVIAIASKYVRNRKIWEFDVTYDEI